MGQFAARVGDLHAHVPPFPLIGGPALSPGKPTVWIGGLPAATVLDLCACVPAVAPPTPPPTFPIVTGSFTVYICGMPAARMGDKTLCGGIITTGCPNVLIGDFGMGGAGAFAALPITIQTELLDGMTNQMARSFKQAVALANGGSPPSSAKLASTPLSKTTVPKECAYLSKPGTVESSKADFDRIRKPAKLGTPKEIKHKFPGDTTEQDALEYEVEVDGQKKKLIMPKGTPSGSRKAMPTAQQTADALGTVPGAQLDKIDTVVISPNPNPDDAYWAKEYKDPNFVSGATGGGGGVTFYPADSWSQESIDSTIIHEGGHVYSEKLWKDKKKQKEWEQAMADDGQSPSAYSDSAPTEDFSESLVMYSLSKGTSCEATAKMLYPNRYAVMDGLFAPKPSAPPPAP